VRALVIAYPSGFSDVRRRWRHSDDAQTMASAGVRSSTPSRCAVGSTEHWRPVTAGPRRI